MSVVGAACFTAFPNLFRSNRASNGNLLVGVHEAVTPADFTAYCVTAPQDPGLPGGGQQICGNWDINPDKFGQARTRGERATDFGVDISQVYNQTGLIPYDAVISTFWRRIVDAHGQLVRGEAASPVAAFKTRLRPGERDVHLRIR